MTNHFGFCGAYRGEFEGVAPAGKQVEFRSNSTDIVVAGKVVESSVELDALGVMRQVDAIPTPGQSEEA